MATSNLQNNKSTGCWWQENYSHTGDQRKQAWNMAAAFEEEILAQNDDSNSVMEINKQSKKV